jgi:transcriptional regulator with XRE-family HTH domain
MPAILVANGHFGMRPYGTNAWPSPSAMCAGPGRDVRADGTGGGSEVRAGAARPPLGLGNRSLLRAARHTIGASQGLIAARTRVSAAVYRNYEAGTTRVPQPRLQALADAFGMSLPALRYAAGLTDDEESSRAYLEWVHQHSPGLRGASAGQRDRQSPD